MKLVYKDNIVRNKIACIFVHTESKGLKYNEANDRKDAYKELFEKTLEFERVDIHVDPSRAEMVEILLSLRVDAEKFESTRADFDDGLAVCVVNIGYNMVMDFGPHHFVKQRQG